MGAITGTGGIYDSPAELLADPDYVLAPCGAVVHVDDNHEADPCELCDALRRRSEAADDDQGGGS